MEQRIAAVEEPIEVEEVAADNLYGRLAVPKREFIALADDVFNALISLFPTCIDCC